MISDRISQNKVIGICLIAAVVFVSVYPSAEKDNIEYSYNLKAFSSYDEFFSYFNDRQSNYTGYLYYNGWARTELSFDDTSVPSGSEATIKGGSDDYSATNVQVAGVDEPDIVKTDGEYIYVISESNVYIVKAFPSENTSISSIITETFWPINIFVKDNRLIIFGDSYRYPVKSDNSSSYYSNVPTTLVKIYDISEKSSPLLIKTIETDGYYFNARMIGDFVYLITAEYTYFLYSDIYDEDTINYFIPKTKSDNVTNVIDASDIYYIDMPQPSEVITHVIAFDILSGENVSEKAYLVGSAHTVYVSQNCIYLTQTKYSFQSSFQPDIFVSDYESTIINKIIIENGTIEFAAQGEISGHVLNQFSMDEHNGFFRIATTSGNMWDGSSNNNIFVLDSNLSVVGSIRNISIGERIYSSRFMGDKAFLVTFKNTDPFFTIDLSDPYNPSIIGELKIPGYSDYLHPYDENNIIGIGKDTVESSQDDFAWYQGVKIAVFNVSDFNNPQEVHKVIIGDRGTTSPILYDHKALLFDKSKNLFVIPITLYEIDEKIKIQNNNTTGGIHGEYTFQGAYVYRLTLDNGFELVGRITHMDDADVNYSKYYYRYENPTKSIQRTLYIEDNLYTISKAMIKINDIETLEPIATLILG